MVENNFVVTRTPLRVSFVGGGSDLPEFYKVNEQGKVISLALNKYLYVVVKKHSKIFGEKYRISYSENEICEEIKDIKNNVIRETIKFSNIDCPLYISTFSDIPAESGLGSSSALAVGLLNAMYSIRGKAITRNQLAEEAAHIEMNCLNQPIGKQDHYASAFGGFNRSVFNRNGTVDVSGLKLSSSYFENILKSGTLYWTGLTRQVEKILHEQQQNFLKNEFDHMYKILENVNFFEKAIRDKKPISTLASIVSASWEHKKKLSSKITNKEINIFYDKLIKNGGLGGKLCGGGGGGFILMFHHKNQSSKINKNNNLKYQIPLGVDFSGSIVLMNSS